MNKSVPEIDLSGSPVWVTCRDKAVAVLAQSRTPRVVVLGGLLSNTECDEVMELARGRLARSQVVDLETGKQYVHTARTSEGGSFARAETPLIARIEQRLSDLVGWPVARGEGMQVMRYGPGAEYQPHYDYFDPSGTESKVFLGRGGQRVATVVMYLNNPLRGGGTVFPDSGLTVGPVKGNAVFFSYDRPHPDTRTLHGGAPVEQGEKWIMTKWFREQDY